MIKSRSIEPSDIIRTFKQDRCCDFMEEKYNNPRLTQKEICNQLGFTDRTIRRYRDDIKMDSPYRINNNKKNLKNLLLLLQQKILNQFQKRNLKTML